MAKLKSLVIEPTDNPALQWHFGIVTEPPLDRAGKEYLAQYLPKRYHLEGDVLVRIMFLSHVILSEPYLGCQEDRATSGA